MYSSIVYLNTEYGKITCNLKKKKKKRNISIYRLADISNIKYEVIKRYYDNNILRYDANILAKLCFCLNCEVDSLLKYEK